MRPKLMLFVLAETILLACLLLLLAQGSDANSATAAPLATEMDAAGARNDVDRAPTGSQTAAAARVEHTEHVGRDGAYGVLLHGRVLDPQGHAIPRASLYLNASTPRSGRTVDVDSEGRYAVAAIEPGTWSFRADAEAFRLTTGTVVVPAGVEFFRQHFVLPRAQIIRVRARTSDGKPLAEVIDRPPFHFRNRLCAIARTSALPTALEPDTHSTPFQFGDAEWRSVENREAVAGPTPDWIGNLELLADPPVHVALMLRQTVLAQQFVSAGEAEVLFEFTVEDLLAHCGSVQVQIVSAATGQPLPNASVGLGNAQGRGGGGPLGEGARFSAIGLAPGLWELSVQAAEHAPHFEQVLLSSGQQLELGRIALHPVMHVRGRVLDAKGKPVPASLHIDALESRKFPQEMRDYHTYRVSAEGEFDLPLGRERYVLRTMSTEHEAAHVLVDATSGAVADLEIRLEQTETIRIENHIPRSEYFLVLVQTRDRLPVWGQTLRWGYTPILRLPRGNYVVDIYRGTTPVRSFALNVGADPVSFRVP